MASYNYKGTKITGTSTKAKVFKKSKIKKAKKNQTYLNKSTGHVYKCTHGGKPSEAKWKYTRTDIVAKPSLAVQGLGAPTRNGTKMNAAWNIPADLISNKKGDRATGYNIYWYLGIPGNDPSKVLQVASAGAKTSQVDLNNFWVGRTKYDRKSFYPNTKNKLSYVSVKVAPKNAKGEGGKPTTATRNFEIPRVPTISGFSFNNETGVISVTITTDPGNDYKERYDTKYKMTVTDTRQNKTWAQIDDKSTNTSITLSYNIRNYQELTWDDYVKVTVTAYARGYAGASATTSKTAYVSFPQKTTIEDVAVTGKTGQDKCTVLIKTNSTTEHPVDRVRLEYLANCIYDTAESIPSGESWTESDIVDDASCTAMSISVSNLIPERGHYTWVRVVSWHYNENVLYRVSDYMRVTDLETPAATAADDEITILSASPGEDGRSIIVELGWNADGEDDSDGTELSWADEEDTWKSTRTPDSFMFEWSDGPVTVGQITYQDSATITIKDLQEGTRYFIRARRYMEGETTEYSPYSNTSTAITSETPETIVATCDRYVAKGHSLAIYWTFSGNGVQKEWQIVAEDGTVIANGDDSMTTTQISSNRLESLVTDNSLSFTVQASTGGNFVISDLQTVTIVDNPELDITGSSLVHVHEEAEREFSGEIATFEPDSNERLKSLTASIEPQQDLHGYDKPWAPGGGKNKIDPSTVTSYNDGTAFGMTYSWDSAKECINISGTFTGTSRNVGFRTIIVSSSIRSYNVKGFSTSSNFNYLRWQSGENSIVAELVNLVQNTTYNIEIYPIVYDGTEPTSWTPWENICPITGTNKVELVAAGKNLLNPDYNAWSAGSTYLHINGVVPKGIDAHLTLIDKDTSVSLSGIYFGWVYDDVTSSQANYYKWCINNGNLKSNTTNLSDNIYAVHKLCQNLFIYPNTEESFEKLFARYDIQVELGTSATGYEPYTGTKSILYDGTNMWDEEWELGGIDATTGQNYASNLIIRSTNYIPVKGGETYRVHIGGSSSLWIAVLTYDAEKNFLANAGGKLSGAAFTLDSNVSYIRFYVTTNYGTTYNNDISINYPATEFGYHPYHPYTVGTVFGCTIDVSTGLMTIDRAMVDLGSLDWAVVSAIGHVRFDAGISDLAPNPTDNLDGYGSGLYCEIYATDGHPITNNSVNCAIARYGKRVYIRDDRFTSAADFKSAMSGVQLCYELAEPYTIELTPTQVELLTGTNNVWADTGSVEVKLTETTKDEDQLQTNNLSLEFTSNRLCDLIVIVISQGAVGQFPAGIRRQTAGDTIHSAVYSPEWTEDNDVFTASINLPTGLDFWDLGRYTVSVVAIDRETGLRSEEASASFAVEWAKQAVDIRPTTTYAVSTDTVVDEDKTYYTYDSTTESYLPVEDPAGDENPSEEGWYEATITNYVTLTPIDETDDTGYHRQAVQIALIPPPGSEETDLYDIYRLTGDGAVLIGESFPLTCTTTDEYAPFGEDMTLNYRVALRTIDGDVSFADFEYVQDSSHLRFDWATGFVEYPYNLSIGDSYKKDVEFRSHLDGGIDGYWNQNIERQAKLSTDLIWIEQQDVIDKTRELARYAGPVYVRTPEGTAYEADVQVTDMSGTNNIIMAVAIDATEVDVTAEFLLPTPYRKEEESE